MKDKISYNDVGIKKADKIIYGKYPDLDWHDRIKDKTALFANKNDKYKKENQNKTAR